MAKTKFDIKTEATRPLYAGVGVTDLAVEFVRGYVTDVQHRVADVQKNVTELDLQPQALREQAVTVVEWGEGLAEGLSESRLEVHIVRGDGVDVDDEHRRVEITPGGPRWHALSFRGLG